MAHNWTDTPLGDVITLQRGFDLPIQDREIGNVPIVSSSGVTGTHSQVGVRAPGVVTGRYGTIGQVFYIEKDFWPLNTTLYVKDFKGNDPRFISYLLQTIDYLSCSDKSSVPGVNRNDLHQIIVAVPKISEQRTIAKILETLDAKIELNRRMNETLEAMVRAIFKSWFVDFDPVRAKAGGRHPFGMGTQTAALFPSSFVDSTFGKIPKGWSASDLANEIDFLEGPGIRNWQYRPEGIRFLNIRCIGNGDLHLETANCVSKEEFDGKYSHFALKENDIVISTSGTLGRLAIVREDHLPVMLNTSIIRMRGRNAIGLSYLWATLQSDYFLEEMFALASGSVQLNFGPMHLRRMKILCPLDDVLISFERLVSPLIRLTLANRKESGTLATIRSALLPKLISGEIRVKASE